MAGHGPLHRRVPVLCLVTHAPVVLKAKLQSNRLDDKIYVEVRCSSVLEQGIEGLIESFERHFDVNLLS